MIARIVSEVDADPVIEPGAFKELERMQGRVAADEGADASPEVKAVTQEMQVHQTQTCIPFHISRLWQTELYMYRRHYTWTISFDQPNLVDQECPGEVCGEHVGQNWQVAVPDTWTPRKLFRLWEHWAVPLSICDCIYSCALQHTLILLTWTSVPTYIATWSESCIQDRPAMQGTSMLCKMPWRRWIVIMMPAMTLWPMGSFTITRWSN